MHRNLYRVSVHQCLDTFGLVSVGQLVCGIYVDFNFAAGCFFHELAELTSAFCPGTGLSGGAGKVPGLLFPSKVTVIGNIVVILIAGGSSICAAIRTIAAGSVEVRCRCYGSGISSVFCQRFWKERGNLRNIRNQKQNRYRCRDHWHNGFGNLLNGNFHSFFQFYGNGNKQVDTNRWSYLSDGQVDGCHDTECYQVIAKGFADRKHNRDENVHRRVCIDKASCNQENDVDDQQECKLIMCNTSEQIGSCLRDTEFGADKREQGSTCYDQHNTAGGLCRVYHQIPQIFDLNFFVDKDSDKQTVYNGNGCCFCWSEYASIDTAKNNNRHQESPERILKCIPSLFCRCLLLRRLNVVFLCLKKNNDYKSNTHQDTRNDTCGEHICNGYAGDGCVNNECDTRRNDDCDRTRCRHQRCGKRCGEAAALDHGRNQNHTKSCNSCRTGTGNSAEEAGNDNAHDGDTAFFVADTCINETDQPFGDTRLCHDISGQNKERNGKQQEFTDAGIHVGGNDRQRCAGI